MDELNIARLVPDFLMEDPNGYALAKAIEAGARMFIEDLGRAVDIIHDVDRMPEWRLDEMAWELNAAWYDYGADVETKRVQIRGAQAYYNRLGTPYAVQRAINDVYGEGRIEEWFEYGGEPYYFRVFTTNTRVLLENRKHFLWLLETVKNVRSVLENVYYYGSGETGVDARTGIVSAAGRDRAIALGPRYRTGVRAATAITTAAPRSRARALRSREYLELRTGAARTAGESVREIETD